MSNVVRTKWYNFIPNLITLFNLACGVIGIYFAFNNNIEWALYFMFIGAFFDFCDGFFARLLKVSGELGKQLDSLADMVTFGVLPGTMIFTIQQKLLIDQLGTYQNFTAFYWILLISPILIPTLSALRLAKFNIDTRQSHSFIGLPTPANALFFASVAWSIDHGNNIISSITAHPVVLFILSVIFSLLLISSLPMFALKFKSIRGQDNYIRYLFLLTSLFLILFLQITGITLIIILYLLLSIANNLLFSKKA